MLKEIIYKILLFFGFAPLENNDDEIKNNPVYYTKKFLSDSEINFYNKLSSLKKMSILLFHRLI